MKREPVRGALPEKGESLWLLAAGPLAWAAHFLLSYGTAAIWHAKAAPGSPGVPVQAAIGVYTVLALGAIAVVAWRGWRRHRLGGSAPPHDDDSPAGRHRFLGHAALLLAGMSAIAVLYAQLAAVLAGSWR
jgi:hypothetical protein